MQTEQMGHCVVKIMFISLSNTLWQKSTGTETIVSLKDGGAEQKQMQDFPF